MSLPIDTHIPSYVHDLVVDAGRDNVYWATARDPGDRPGAGQTMDEWRNRVVGSSIGASQSTASNQPIWRGDRLEFAGDDHLGSDVISPDPDHVIFATVWDPVKAGVGYSHAVEDTVGDGLVHQIAVESTGDMRTQAQDDSGNLYRANIALKYEPQVTLSYFSLGADRVEGVTYTESDQSILRATESIPSGADFSAFDSSALGARPDGSNQITADVWEMMYAMGASLTSSELDDLVRSLAHKWRI